MEKKYLDSVRIRYPPSEKKLNEILEASDKVLVQSVPNIQKIILFGSYATGKPHFGSDVDLVFIVSERTSNDFEKIYEKLFDLSSEYEWSPLVYSEEQFDKLKQKSNSFYREIMKTGRIIFP
jgi:predicted nucleotidyltransferase